MRKQTALLLGFLAAVSFASCGNKTEEKKTETSMAQKQLPPNHPPIGDNKTLPPGHPAVGGNKTLPPGHPAVGGNKTLPPGHPNVEGMNGGMAGMGMGMDGMNAGMHPESMTKLTKPVNIPEEVKETWKSAEIAIVDKTTGKVAKKLKVKAGEVVKLGNTKIEILYVVPDLKLMANEYTSASNEPNNPAIIVKATLDGKVTFEGPLYEKFQIFHINNPKYDVKLLKVYKD